MPRARTIPLAVLVTASLAAALPALTATDARAQAAFSRVSVAFDGSLANADSDGASSSADGRYVAFSSAASNLVPNDTNGSRDIFVRDRVLNVTTRVSVTSDGEERIGDSTAPDIGASGRFVVFISTAPLVAGDTQTCQPAPELPRCADIYVHDRDTGATTRASLSSGGAQPDGDSYEPHISSDGRFVVFESLATNLGGEGTPQVRHAFLRDRQNDTTIRLHGDPSLAQRPGEPEPRISDDGSTVTFSAFVEPSLLPVTANGTPPSCWHAGACPATLSTTRRRVQPIVVERAMWWPSPNWYEAHLAAGTTATGTRWALADGEIGSAGGETYETYILIANTGSDGAATITLLVEGGDRVVTQIPLKGFSRTNVPVSGLFPAGTNAKFGAIIESDGARIVVERAIYTSAGGVTWTAGTATVATKLQ